MPDQRPDFVAAVLLAGLAANADVSRSGSKLVSVTDIQERMFCSTFRWEWNNGRRFKVTITEEDGK